MLDDRSRFGANPPRSRRREAKELLTENGQTSPGLPFEESRRLSQNLEQTNRNGHGTENSAHMWREAYVVSGACKWANGCGPDRPIDRHPSQRAEEGGRAPQPNRRAPEGCPPGAPWHWSWTEDVQPQWCNQHLVCTRRVCRPITHLTSVRSRDAQVPRGEASWG